jgi:hypothetical protein
MKFMKDFINSIVKTCPYTLIGKKCIDGVRGKTKAQANKNLNDRILSFKLGIKTGRNITGTINPTLANGQFLPQ